MPSSTLLPDLRYAVLDSRTGEVLAYRDSYTAALRLHDYYSESLRSVHVRPAHEVG